MYLNQNMYLLYYNKYYLFIIFIYYNYILIKVTM